MTAGAAWRWINAPIPSNGVTLVHQIVIFSSLSTVPLQVEVGHYSEPSVKSYVRAAAANYLTAPVSGCVGTSSRIFSQISRHAVNVSGGWQ